MRDLGVSDKNELVINDARSGTELTIYYRNPTNREEALYQAKLVKRKGKKIIVNTYDTRLLFGLRIITGFKEGDFCLDGKEISSDPMSSRFFEHWKDLLKEGAADIVTTLAQAVFEGATTGGNIDVELATLEEELEEAIPLETSSGGSSTNAPRREGESA